MKQFFAFLVLASFLAAAMAVPVHEPIGLCGCCTSGCDKLKTPEERQNFRTLFQMASAVSKCENCHECCGRVDEFKAAISAHEKTMIKLGVPNQKEEDCWCTGK